MFLFQHLQAVNFLASPSTFVIISVAVLCTYDHIIIIVAKPIYRTVILGLTMCRLLFTNSMVVVVVVVVLLCL